MSDQPISLYGDQPEPPPSQPPSLMDLIEGVFTSPKQLFSRLRTNPVWVSALVLAIAIGLIAMLIWASKVDMAEVTRHQMERMKDVFHVNIPDQAIDDAITKAEGKKPWLSAVSGAILGTPFVYLIVGLIVWGFASMGTEEGETSPTFGQAFSLTVVHYLVTLPSMLLAAIIALIHPVGGRSIQQLMPTTLSFYWKPEGNLLRALVALVDPLWLVSFVLLAIGMRQTLKTKTWAIGTCLGFMGVFGAAFRIVGSFFQ